MTSWRVAAPADRIRSAEELGRRLGIGGPVVETPTVGALGRDVAAGIVFHGTDHELALAASRITVPIALAPAGDSDLSRMFASGGRIDLTNGAPYAADLGFAFENGATHPFVAHAVVSKRGRLPGMLGRRRSLTLEIGGGVQRHRAVAVAIVNAQHVAGENLAPRSALMDGVADVQVLRNGLGRRSRQRGLHLKSAGVTRRRAAEADVAAPDDWVVATDGVIVGTGRCRIRIEPAAYTLWV